MKVRLNFFFKKKNIRIMKKTEDIAGKIDMKNFNYYEREG